ncbi:MAG TPA: hypothetical protein PK514_11240 [Spirochaetota bacterium]|nr:hypothetical protein [Spirochaetota bacterium]
MKRKLIPAAVCMIIAASAAVLMSEDENYIGKTGEINSGKKEIIVNVKSGTVLKMGDLLQVETEAGKITLEVTFPMQTVAKCKIKGRGKYSDLRTGMGVYMYSKDEAVDETAVKPGSAYKIGDRGPAGGWIFYDKGNTSDGWRYLEAASEDQSAGSKWGCKGQSTGARGTAIGTGKANTAAIIKSCGEERIAAKVAADYRGGGKSDWFLPSKDELNMMYENLHKTGVGGFADYYWSSSEDDDLGAQGQLFSNGYQYTNYYYNADRVRAVRAF